MNHFLVLFMLLLTLGSVAQSKTAVASTGWSVASTWSPAVVPTLTDTVLIPSGISVTAPSSNTTVASLTVYGNLNSGTIKWTINGPLIVGDGTNAALFTGVPNANTALTVTGSLTVNANGTLTTDTNPLITGATSISGTVNLTAGSSRACVYTGNFTINSGGNWNDTSSSARTDTFGGNFTNNGTYTVPSNGVKVFNVAGKTISGSTSFPTLTITSPGNVTNSGTLTIGTLLSGTGSLSNTGILNIGQSAALAITGLTASAIGNTVNYNRSGGQTVRAIDYVNLGLGGTNSKAIATGTTISGNLTINGTASALIADGVNITVGTLIFGTTVQLGGTYGSTFASNPATNTSSTYFGSTTTGIVTVPSTGPTITGGTTSTTAFTTNYGTASAPQTFTIGGTNLGTTAITATAPTGFEVSSDGTTYGNTATFAPSTGSVANGQLRVRLAATASVGSYNSNTIVLSSGLATPVNISTAASGNQVFSIDPFISATPSPLAFGYVKNNTSSILSYNLTAGNLTSATGNITVTAPTGYLVSTSNSSGFASSITVPYTASALTATPIYVKFSPTVTQSYNNSISLSGGGATASLTLTGAGSDYNVGSYKSVATGNWGAIATWNKWDGAAWQTSTDFPNLTTADVYILGGFTVTAENSSRSCASLYVDGLSALIATIIVKTPVYLKIYGNTVSVASGSRIGNAYIGDTADGISFDVFSNNLTVTGGGLISVSRIRTNTASTIVTIDTDVTLNYHGSGNLGNAAGFYILGDSNTLTVNAGKTLTFAPWSCLFYTSGSHATNSNLSQNINLYGTMTFVDGDLSGALLNNGWAGHNNYFTMNVNTTASSTLNVYSGGVLNVSEFYPNGTKSDNTPGSGNLVTINVATGGKINVSKIADFRNAAQTITGGGEFNLLSGATMQIAAASGLEPVAGPIRTTTRNFSTGANYTYSPTVTQIVTTTSSSINVTLSASNSNITVGMIVTGTGITSGTTVASITGTALTLSQIATVAGFNTLSFYNNNLVQVTGIDFPTTVNSLTINNGAAVTLGANTTVNGTLTQTSGKLAIGSNTLTLNGIYVGNATNSLTGSSTSNLTTTGNTGTIYFDQTTVGTTNMLKNLNISGSYTTTLGNPLNITAGTLSGTVTVGTGATLASGGNLNLKSDNYGTASVGNSAGTISGNVTVERYIPAKRAWRALTAPVVGTSNTSVFYNWQNNGATVANTGVEIWSNLSTDASVTPNAGGSSSMLSYNSVDNNWTPITNTNTTSLFSSTINNPFMTFVTGPYAPTSTNITSGAAITTLKATGTLLSGTQTYACPSGPYTFIGNPYASPLSLSAMLTDNASFNGNIWVWDANATGTYSVGTYNMFDLSTLSYSNSTSNPIVVAGTLIQSGQAFFVKQSSGIPVNFLIQEAHKGITFSNAVFRDAAPAQLLRVGLYKQINTEWSGRDGAMAVFLSDANANQLPNKMANGTENVAFTKNAGLFASEHHLPLVATDVLDVKVWNTTAGANYKLKINTEQFATTNLDATLEDLFTNSRTTLTLDGTAIEYPFTVTTEAASTGNRFRIVFQNAVLGMNNPKANGITVLPNPITGDTFQVNLGTLTMGTYSYTICNALGQEVEKGSINNVAQNTNYAVKFKNNTAAGMYIMKVTGTDNTVFTAKIIKK